MTGGKERLRVLRIVTRMNVGGPSRHVLVLSGGVRTAETTLAAGVVEDGEAEAAAWIAAHGAEVRRIPSLARSVKPLRDIRALREIRALIRDARPHLVHTHTSKAGLLGRIAARAERVPLSVHTFHGHVLDGYFGGFVSSALVRAERALAARTDGIVAVSGEIARELAEVHRIAPRERIDVIPVGLPLEPFLGASKHRGKLRAELAAGRAPIVAWSARLAPVKDLPLAMAAWKLVRDAVPDAVLVVAGDGPERAAAEAAAPPGARFIGWRDDMASLLADVELAFLTSRREGTPVALIEAAAAGVPAVATSVGGVPSVVLDGKSGLLAAHGDAAALAAHVVSLLRDRGRRESMGRAAREHARARFSAERLCRDTEALYARLVASHG
ncbi:MAG: D-inositol-3-phosphate glycosyltransferase [Planctomycetes bacterium]|nr:D-inositol-3-phosphate glycosyltransferase [Planctomycetota bacterium]